MPEIAISIRDLGKRYYIGTQGNLLQTFRESLSEIPQWFRKKTKSAVKNILDTSSSNASDIDPETPEGSFWALRDINFDVQQGDVVGIIGRNGAGKTTLLKILSKITQPTKGMVTLHGRAASLLEVGTGFHSELTGRENIFLNGAILGMKRSEIKSKFDEIVEFSEVEKFLDTPVKHYSSGMRVRLAFAVAAHLEAEILLVDEVLAVGDAAFQKKCLGKMGEVSKQGRTVLFVSHNMAAVENLCQKGVLLEKGKISSIGTIGESVSKYMSSMNNDVYDLSQRTDRLGTGQIRLTQIDIRDDDNNRVEFVKSGQNINIYLHFRKNTSENIKNIIVGILFNSQLDVPIFLQHNLLNGVDFGDIPNKGVFICRIPHLPLVPANYKIAVSILPNNAIGGIYCDRVDPAMNITVIEGDFFGTGLLPACTHGYSLVEGDWKILKT